MSDVTFTFRVGEDLKAAFVAAARGQDRNGAQLLRDFMREVVQRDRSEGDYVEWLGAKVERARASAEAGVLIDAAHVDAEFATRRAVTRSKLDAGR